MSIKLLLATRLQLDTSCQKHTQASKRLRQMIINVNCLQLVYNWTRVAKKDTQASKCPRETIINAKLQRTSVHCPSRQTHILLRVVGQARSGLRLQDAEAGLPLQTLVIKMHPMILKNSAGLSNMT